MQALWNSVLTALVVSVLAGLFVAAMPPVYRATAIVKGDAEDMLLVSSGELLAEVMDTTAVPVEHLYGWFERYSETGGEGPTVLRQKLTVSKGSEINWINISVEGSHQDSVSQLANALARAFLDRVRQNELTVSAKEKLFEPVEKADEDIALFLSRHPEIVDLEGETGRIEAKIADVRRRMSADHRSQVYLAEQMTLAKNRVVANLDDNAVAHAARQRNVQKQTLAGIATRYGSKHMKFLAADAVLDTYLARLEDAFVEAEARLLLERAVIDGRLSILEAR